MSMTVFTQPSIHELPFLGANTEGDVRLNGESDHSQNYALRSSPHFQLGDEFRDVLRQKILPLLDCVKYRSVPRLRQA